MTLGVERAEPITEETWNQYREVISKMYATMKLRELREEMKTLYEFDATESQYKGRITKWKLLKNLRHQEMDQVIYDPSAKKLVRGHVVDNERIKRYLRRRSRRCKDNGIDDTKIEAGEIEMTSVSLPEAQFPLHILPQYMPSPTWFTSFGDESLPNVAPFPFNSQEVSVPELFYMTERIPPCPRTAFPACQSRPPDGLSGLGLFLLMERV
jgi:Clr5 domain